MPLRKITVLPFSLNINKIGALLVLSTLSLQGASNEALYNSCKFCHGMKGEVFYLEKVQPINRLDKASLIAILTGYKEGTIDQIGMGKMMQAQTKNFDPEHIEQLAEYIDSFK